MADNPLNKLPDNPFNKERVSSIVDRAKELIVDPLATWHDVIEEAEPPNRILLNYALPLAAIGPLAGLIGSLAFGYGALGFSGRLGFGSAIVMALSSLLLSIVSLYVVTWIVNFLAPRFGGTRDFASAFRLVTYAMTAAWAAGIFGLVPALSFLGLLGLYSIYIFYTGVRPVLGVSDEQAAAFTVIVFVLGIVANMVTGMMVSTVAGMPTLLI
jgi:hypothetical protein